MPNSLDISLERIAIFAPKTVNHSIKCFRMVFKTAKRDGVVADNPAEFVKTIREQKPTSAPVAHSHWTSFERSSPWLTRNGGA